MGTYNICFYGDLENIIPVVGTHLKCLCEGLEMSIYNTCFYAEVRKHLGPIVQN